MAFAKAPKGALIAVAVALGALYVRFRGIGWGWPGVFDADAPHIVNLAVYFGSGDLNPHIFKYPTLWPYLLSACYAGYFLWGLACGAWNGVAGFGAHFVWHTADFHVLARCVTAGLSALGVWAVWRSAGGRAGGGAALWACAIAAFTPVLADMAHTPKADTILFLFSALAWGAALRLASERTARNAAVCGLWIGLAMSSQYTAATLALLPVSACMLPDGKGFGRSARLVGVSALCAFAALALSSPYIFLAHREFLASMADMARETALVRPAHPRAEVLGALARNIVFYAGPWSAAFLLSLAGWARQWRGSRARALVFLVPCLAHMAVLAGHPYGGWLRFLIPILPAFMILSGAGMSALCARVPAPAAVLAALAVLAPGVWDSFALAGRYALPDTRLEAQNWLERNLPPDSVVLLDQEHASPPLRMSAGQARELFERTSAAGHPRRKYYELMAASHPGGGYRIYRIERSPGDLESRPEHVRWSNSARDMLDIGPGLTAAETAGVGAVVLSSYGIDPGRCPEYAPFVAQLKARWRLAASFKPVGGHAGPSLEIYVKNKRQLGL